jgi:ankyrin repeat protein
MGEKMSKTIAAAMLALVIAVPAWAGLADDEAHFSAIAGYPQAVAAALAHDIEGMKIALKNGADANAPSTTARRVTPLQAAASGFWHLGRDRAKDLAQNQAALKLSQEGFSDEEIDKYLAVEITKLLFAAGAKLGPYDQTILFFPISNGNVELVRLLIDKGASVTGDLEGLTPTQLAKQHDQEAIYELLISRGGIRVDRRASAQLALVETAARGNVEGMEKAIKDGSRINDFDANKETALVAAVRFPAYGPWAEAVWWLLDHGADPNQKGDSGFRDLEGLPLHIFVAMNKTTLEGVPARPTAKPMAEETLARLLKAGAKVSGMDSQDRTPLHIAAKFDNVRAAEILIKEGAKVMPKDKQGKTPLDYAESAAMIKLLKQNGASER